MKKILSFLIALLLLFSCAGADSLIYGSGTWECPSCGSLNCGQHCGACGAPIPLWQCPACSGFMTSPYCVNCGMEKYYSLGTAALAVSDFEAAIGYLESSRSPEAWDALAGAWVQAARSFEYDHDYENALYCYQNAEVYGADVSDKVSHCSYQLATVLYREGDYPAAMELLDSLGDYRDSADAARDCRYQQALL